jgi:F-type H+-transporting ATPase subunit delta
MSQTVRENAAGLRARLDERRDDPGLPGVAGELFAAADLIGSDVQLRTALSDAGQPASARTSLVHALFDERLSPIAVQTLADLVAQRWSDAFDMVEVLEALGAQAAFLVSQREGSLDSVEDQLFGFAQSLAGSAHLQMALTDPAVGSAAKSALVGSLLEGRAAAQTSQVLSYALSHLRGRRADAVMTVLMDLAAEQRNRSVAHVRVARPLDHDQAARLTGALSRLHGRDIRLNVAVDPEVIGGIAVRVGDEVMDATIATRIDQARRAMVG